MADVEVIEFSVPQGSANLLYLPEILGDVSVNQVYDGLYQSFSKFGLLYQLTVKEKGDGVPGFYAYIRFYSARCTSRARAAVLRQDVRLHGCQPFKVSRSSSAGSMRMPLAKYKCEELANYYLGFSGWRSTVLYHKREDSDPLTVKYVSVMKLEFPQFGMSCEGAGLTEAASIEDGESYVSVIVKTAKKSLGEALIAAWSKVVLVVVDGVRVAVEINTTKADAFFYNPLWDEPVVQVNEVEEAQVPTEPMEETEPQPDIQADGETENS